MELVWLKLYGCPGWALREVAIDGAGMGKWRVGKKVKVRGEQWNWRFFF